MGKFLEIELFFAVLFLIALVIYFQYKLRKVKITPEGEQNGNTSKATPADNRSGDSGSAHLKAPPDQSRHDSRV